MTRPLLLLGGCLARLNLARINLDPSRPLRVQFVAYDVRLAIDVRGRLLEYNKLSINSE